MKRVRRHIAVTLILACTIGIAQAAEKAGKTKTLTPGMFQVKVTNDYLSLQANEAPLAKIFEEIGKQAGITIDYNLGPEEKITIQLDRVSLEDAINRLATNVTIFYAQDPNQKSRRISRVVVLAEGTRRAPPLKRAEAPRESSKTVEPAPRPAPFKFEFDPAQVAETEKPRKKP